eukprot:4248739-Pleurochrysis_carterae.AAC.2
MKLQSVCTDSCNFQSQMIFQARAIEASETMLITLLVSFESSHRTQARQRHATFKKETAEKH